MLQGNTPYYIKRQTDNQAYGQRPIHAPQERARRIKEMAHEAAVREMLNDAIDKFVRDTASSGRSEESRRRYAEKRLSDHSHADVHEGMTERDCVGAWQVWASHKLDSSKYGKCWCGDLETSHSPAELVEDGFRCPKCGDAPYYMVVLRARMKLNGTY